MAAYRIEIRWAFIFLGMMLLWMVLEKVAGLHDVRIHLHPIVTNFIAIPAILIYVFAFLDKRKVTYGGTMTYWQGFVTGAIMTLIIAVFSPVVQYISSTFITPDYFSHAIAYAVEQGEMQQQAAEDYFNLNNYLVQSAIGAFVMGLVTSAIVAIFTRRSVRSTQVHQ